MNKIVELHQLEKDLASVDINRNKIVIAGGCFDSIHEGHISFLKAAKGQGSLLFVLLESDEDIKRRKGKDRPIYSQAMRAKSLSALYEVDVVICLTPLMTDSDYDRLVSQIKPAIIATTKGDPYRSHKERQAKLTEAKVVDVIERIPKYSTTDLLTKTHDNE